MALTTLSRGGFGLLRGLFRRSVRANRPARGVVILGPAAECRGAPPSTPVDEYGFGDPFNGSPVSNPSVTSPLCAYATTAATTRSSLESSITITSLSNSVGTRASLSDNLNSTTPTSPVLPQLLGDPARSSVMRRRKRRLEAAQSKLQPLETLSHQTVVDKKSPIISLGDVRFSAVLRRRQGTVPPLSPASRRSYLEDNDMLFGFDSSTECIALRSLPRSSDI